MSGITAHPHVSIVIPVYNEEANLPLLFTRLTPMGAMTHEATTHIMDRIVARVENDIADKLAAIPGVISAGSSTFSPSSVQTK